ncbi:MAG: CHAT domain-containing protein [Leptolyngbyaceae cyanobacterium RU_5_1]|nr:CHAT domain-containing protein [Leptolyngbyaceae cyanobacterium RU_5_1]
MSQRVVLDLGRGDFNSGFSAVTAQVWNDRNPYPMKFVGSLPAAPEISQLHRSWQLLYRALNHRLDWSSRIEIDAADVTNVSQVEFGEICRQLADQINCWLNSESFRSIDQPLRTQLNAADEIRVLIETSDRQLQQLPWHLWSFFEHYPQAEIALSDLEYQRSRSTPSLNNNDKVRILAIFGDSENIDLSQDRAFLEQSENSTIDFLIEPSRKQLYDRLWQGCDVLFFAGHSSSQGQGEIRLNPVDNLTLAQLKYGLRRAISQGLKLVIFNSCDGLGLAQQLAELHIPQVIVMREPVPDKVAHTFLNYFLVSFLPSGDRSMLPCEKPVNGFRDWSRSIPVQVGCPSFTRIQR